MYNQEEPGQFELFPGANQETPVFEITRPLKKDLTLSIENVIVLCVVLIMSLVLFFSLGVEQGKKWALRHLPPEEVVQATPPAKVSADDGIVVLPTKEPKDSLKEKANKVLPAAETQVVLNVPVEVSEPAPVPVAPGMYTVQVASFKQESYAQKEATKIKDLGHDTFVLAKGNYFIVCVGKFAGKAEANKTADRLKNKYSDYLVRRL